MSHQDHRKTPGIFENFYFQKCIYRRTTHTWSTNNRTSRPANKADSSVRKGCDNHKPISKFFIYFFIIFFECDIPGEKRKGAEKGREKERERERREEKQRKSMSVQFGDTDYIRVPELGLRSSGSVAIFNIVLWYYKVHYFPDSRQFQSVQ